MFREIKTNLKLSAGNDKLQDYIMHWKWAYCTFKDKTSNNWMKNAKNMFRRPLDAIEEKLIELEYSYLSEKND